MLPSFNSTDGSRNGKDAYSGYGTTSSGSMPSSWIQLPSGVNHLAVVNFRFEPSDRSFAVWTVPLPKVFSPTKVTSADSLIAPAKISEAEALPPSINKVTGISNLSPPVAKYTSGSSPFACTSNISLPSSMKRLEISSAVFNKPPGFCRTSSTAASMPCSSISAMASCNSS